MDKNTDWVKSTCTRTAVRHGTGKQLKYLFGITFLSQDDVEGSLSKDSCLPSRKTTDSKYADYLLENYVTQSSKFSPEIWAEIGEQGATYSNYYMKDHNLKICSFE